MDILKEYEIDQGQVPVSLAYSEPLFHALGAERVDSLDASSFEGCTVLHDLNTPVDESLHGQYDVVFDGGVLEHVYNFPVAMENSRKMVAEGGFLINVVPCNNECGHGLYQFSPELFFRVLSPSNGFIIHEMLVCERRPRQTRWYRVADPEQLGSRICFHNKVPSYLICVARRTRQPLTPSFFPQQSDYQANWSNRNTDKTRARITKGVPWKKMLEKASPFLHQQLVHAYHGHWICTLRNHHAFFPVCQKGYRLVIKDDKHG